MAANKDGRFDINFLLGRIFSPKKCEEGIPLDEDHLINLNTTSTNIYTHIYKSLKFNIQDFK